MDFETYRSPTPEEIAAIEAKARELRAEALRGWVKAAMRRLWHPPIGLRQA